MLSYFLKSFLLLGILGVATGAAPAQEVVHALTGKVTSINPAVKAMNVATNDGSGGYFQLPDQSSHTPLLFQKEVEALAVPPAKFSRTGDQVVVFFFGVDNNRTSVGVEDLGPGPLQAVTGTVVKLDKHDHVIVVKDDKGTDQTFKIGAGAVADGPLGVIEADKLDVDKGDQIRVMAITKNGTPTAMFVRAL